MQIDYKPADLNARDLYSIMRGHASPRLPEVIGSGAHDNLLVYIVSYVGRQGVFLDVDRPTDTVNSLEDLAITSKDLEASTAAMSDTGRFRRMLMVVEACHAGTLGEDLHTPGVLLLTGANPVENSQASNYDPTLDEFLADDFAWEFTKVASEAPNVSLDELHRGLYVHVKASHVSLYNDLAFGDTRQISLEEFITP